MLSHPMSGGVVRIGPLMLLLKRSRTVGKLSASVSHLGADTAIFYPTFECLQDSKTDAMHILVLEGRRSYAGRLCSHFIDVTTLSQLRDKPIGSPLASRATCAASRARQT